MERGLTQAQTSLTPPPLPPSYPPSLPQPLENECARLSQENTQVNARVIEMERGLTQTQEDLNRYLDEVEEVAGDLLESEMTIKEVRKGWREGGREGGRTSIVI